MPQKIYIDLGYHQGLSLARFRRDLDIDQTWQVHCFEPNPACFRYFDWHQTDVHYWPYAACTFTGNAPFFQEDWEKSQSGSPVRMRRNHLDGWGSTLMGNSSHKGLSEPITVWAIDFAEFLNGLEGEEIFVKMDIEGAEFPILRHLLAQRALARITRLWVEFHERFLPEESAISRRALETAVRRHTQLENYG